MPRPGQPDVLGMRAGLDFIAADRNVDISRLFPLHPRPKCFQPQFSPDHADAVGLDAVLALLFENYPPLGGGQAPV